MLPNNPDDLFLSEIEMEIQNRKVAILFLLWVCKKDYKKDEDGFWYEPPKYEHENGKGLYIAKTTEELYNKYLESLK